MNSLGVWGRGYFLLILFLGFIILLTDVKSKPRKSATSHWAYPTGLKGVFSKQRLFTF
jgi:hypothetical protein